MIIYTILFEWVFLYSNDGKQNNVLYKPGGFFAKVSHNLSALYSEPCQTSKM